MRHDISKILIDGHFPIEVLLSIQRHRPKYGGHKEGHNIKEAASDKIFHHFFSERNQSWILPCEACRELTSVDLEEHRATK